MRRELWVRRKKTKVNLKVWLSMWCCDTSEEPCWTGGPYSSKAVKVAWVSKEAGQCSGLA